MVRLGENYLYGEVSESNIKELYALVDRKFRAKCRWVITRDDISKVACLNDGEGGPPLLGMSRDYKCLVLMGLPVVIDHD